MHAFRQRAFLALSRTTWTGKDLFRAIGREFDPDRVIVLDMQWIVKVHGFSTVLATPKSTVDEEALDAIRRRS